MLKSRISLGSVFAVAAFGQVGALACANVRGVRVCSNDDVVDQRSNTAGRVLGVNLHTGDVSMQASYGSIITVPSGSYAIGVSDGRNRCFDSACTGDTVVDQRSNTLGTVLALNPTNGSVSFRASYGSIMTVPAGQFAVGAKSGRSRCLGVACVDDTLVDQRSNTLGTIIALNPSNGSYSFRASYGSIMSVNRREAALGYGCVTGYCVGDDLIDTRNNTRGKILGVNVFNGTVSYRASYGSIMSVPVSQAAVSTFGRDYDDDYRRRPVWRDGDDHDDFRFVWGEQRGRYRGRPVHGPGPGPGPRRDDRDHRDRDHDRDRRSDRDRREDALIGIGIGLIGSAIANGQPQPPVVVTPVPLPAPSEALLIVGESRNLGVYRWSLNGFNQTRGRTLLRLSVVRTVRMSSASPTGKCRANIDYGFDPANPTQFWTANGCEAEFRLTLR